MTADQVIALVGAIGSLVSGSTGLLAIVRDRSDEVDESDVEPARENEPEEK